MGEKKSRRKRVLAFYRYTECDSMAAYLGEMARKGWHFAEWRMGLVFEKGEPRETEYAVEVFLDGREEDRRPGDEAEEFGEYCEAAGWKLVDGWRRFCVLQKIREDAVPIAAPKERFSNVMRAELWYCAVRLLSVLLMSATRCLDLFWGYVPMWLFSNLSVCLTLIVLGTFAVELCKIVGAGIWGIWCWRQLASGNEVLFGSRGRIANQWKRIRPLGYAVFVLSVIFVFGLCGEYLFMWIFAGAYVVLMLIAVIENLRKPSRSQNLAPALRELAVIPFIVAVFLVGVVFYEQEQKGQESCEGQRVTVAGQEGLDVQIGRIDESESFLGRYRELSADYVWRDRVQKEGHSRKTDGTEEGLAGNITARQYESGWQAFLEYCWERETADISGPAQEMMVQGQYWIKTGTDNGRLSVCVFSPGRVLYAVSDDSWNVETLLSVVENCM